jgi:hypothetical protein
VVRSTPALNLDHRAQVGTGRIGAVQLQCREPVLLPRATLRPGSRSLLGCWVDHLVHLGDLGSRKAADLCVLVDDSFVPSQLDAQRLIGGDEAFHPLDVGSELRQDLV